MSIVRLPVCWSVAVFLVACGGGGGGAGVATCEEYSIPGRANPDSCDDVSLDEPTDLVDCAYGAGYAGRWTSDEHGMPAYELQVEHRCDQAGQHATPLANGPVHLVGNGRGTVAVAHASGAVELYSQDRGHKYVNQQDTWDDPENPAFTKQLGGGFNYVIKDGNVTSTRYDDLGIGNEQQSRLLGVGYFETKTVVDGVLVRRRVFAPEGDRRVLVAEVAVSNLTSRTQELELVEFWDLNLSQLGDETSSDERGPEDIEAIQRARRNRTGFFDQTIGYQQDKRLFTVTTSAKSVPDEITDDAQSAALDYFVRPIYLAVIDQGQAPTGVWLSEAELWGDSPERTPPESVKEPREIGSREVEVDGNQGALAVRVPVVVPGAATVTRRFAFGIAEGGEDPEVIVDDLKNRGSELLISAAQRWHDHLVFAAFPGAARAGAIQRELAWSSYYLAASAARDQSSQHLSVSQGGAYRYYYGVDATPGDMALAADALLFIDPELARETLSQAFAKQHGTQSPTQGRLPYASTGVDSHTDATGFGERSDAYFLLPAVAAKYIAYHRDPAFMAEPVQYWPRTSKEVGEVARHLSATVSYGSNELGVGAQGLMGLGTGDIFDGITELTSGSATPSAASSTFNTAVVAGWFGFAATVFEPFDSTLAADMQSLYSTQVVNLEEEAWRGDHYARGFNDNGSPLADDYLFALPQVMPIVAELVDADRREQLMTLVENELETPMGAMSNQLNPGAGGQAPYVAVVGHVLPVVNSWVTGAYARFNGEKAWDSFIRNTLARHAELHPGRWYGIWTGPQAYIGDGDMVGESSVNIHTAFGTWPGLSTHPHIGPLRALTELVGVSPTATGLRVAPRVPGETFHVRWPFLTLKGTPQELSGSVTTVGSEGVELNILLPTQLRARALRVTVNGQGIGNFRQDGDEITITLPVTPGEPVVFSVLSGVSE
jgi:hypothetical protein